MSAQDNLSHQQLAMYMTAKELHDLPMMDIPEYGTKKDLIAEKLGDNLATGLHDSIKKKGVQEPVTVLNDDGQHLYDGHHRVVSAYNINPKMLVPVEHIE